MKNQSFELLQSYQREMSYLHEMGASFAQQYPKVARRLGVGQEENSDPHVERLIESFAFLTASLQQNINNGLPRIAEALLSVLYPQFVNPLPPASVAHFRVDPTKGKLTTSHHIPKKTGLLAQTNEGVTCQFQTAYALDLWPLKVSEASVVATSDYDLPDFLMNTSHCLKIRIKPLTGTFQDIQGLDQLKFYINGPQSLQSALYEGLFVSKLPLAYAVDEKKQALPLDPSSLHPLGLTPEESVLPMSSKSHPAYTLLLEYFAYPEKFYFFEVRDLQKIAALSCIDLFFPISNPEVLLKLNISAKTFLLGCTPIINLFPKISEPIRVDHLKSEYRLIPDQRRELVTEIHSILSVEGIASGAINPEPFSPYFAFDYASQVADQKSFWWGRRTPAQRPGLPGTDMYLSFVDFEFDPNSPSIETVYAHTLCTNRQLATEVPTGALLQLEDTSPTSQIVCLKQPSSPIYPPQDGQTLWSLISHLSLNKLSLSNDPKSLETLKSFLRLYVELGHPTSAPEIDALVGMKTKFVVDRLGDEAWRNFARGLSIDLIFDTQKGGGSNSFLFASVLNRFFGLYVTLNSFTQVNVKRLNQEGYWKQWEPLSGDQVLL